jgi:hypothetical protein
MARRGGVTFFQVLLSTHAPGTLATPGLPVAPGPAAAREAQTAAVLSSDSDLRFIAGLSGGAGSAVAGSYDDIVTATGGFFFDLNAVTPADFSALADQFEAMIPPYQTATRAKSSSTKTSACRSVPTRASSSTSFTRTSRPGRWN